MTIPNSKAATHNTPTLKIHLLVILPAQESCLRWLQELIDEAPGTLLILPAHEGCLRAGAESLLFTLAPSIFCGSKRSGNEDEFLPKFRSIIREHQFGPSINCATNLAIYLPDSQLSKIQVAATERNALLNKGKSSSVASGLAGSS